jgi:Domain of unknown function (DUF2760)
VADVPLSLSRRLWLAFACFFRVLVDGAFARRVARLEGTEGSIDDTATVVATSPAATSPVHQPAARSTSDGALGLLAIFQREGRLVDFLEQEIDAFPDAEIGAAARVVHGGCRRALRAHFDLARVRSEAEGTTVTVLAEEIAPVKLTGNVRGSAPYRGVLRHAGWRVVHSSLPELASGHDASILCQAEVEL